MTTPYGRGNPYGRASAAAPNRRLAVDTHEELKRELARQAGANDATYYNSGVADPGSGSIVPLQPTQIDVRRTANFIDTTLYFDSCFRNNASQLSLGALSFSIFNLNNNQPIDNIVEMQIGNFYIPHIDTNALAPDYYFYKRVNIEVRELNSQAIRAANNGKFHFEMDVQSAGIADYLTPATNNGKFTFSNPLKNNLDQMTFVFMKPTSPIMFPQDQFMFNAVPGSAPAQIVMQEPHGLTIGFPVTIFVSMFASNVGQIDALINGPDGFLVDVLGPTLLQFQVAAVTGFDFTNVAVPVQGKLVVGFRRVAFTVRFRSISDTETNRIFPV